MQIKEKELTSDQDIDRSLDLLRDPFEDPDYDWPQTWDCFYITYGFNIHITRNLYYTESLRTILWQETTLYTNPLAGIGETGSIPTTACSPWKSDPDLSWVRVKDK